MFYYCRAFRGFLYCFFVVLEPRAGLRFVFYGSRKKRRAFSVVILATSSRVRFRSSAIRCAMSGIYFEEFGCPRNGVGVRYGASVSRSSLSSGTSLSVVRILSAFLKVTIPLYEKTAFLSSQSSSSRGVSAKLWTCIGWSFARHSPTIL